MRPRQGFGRKDGSQAGQKQGGRGRNQTTTCRHPKIKKYRGKRPSPSTSATAVNVGTRMHGGDGKMWVCKTYLRGKKRIKHWVKVK